MLTPIDYLMHLPLEKLIEFVIVLPILGGQITQNDHEVV
jgi:hypothetical protein